MKLVNLNALLRVKRCAYALLAASALSGIPVTSYAELLGQANGRLPTSGTGSPISVELGFTKGSFSSVDYDNKGIRVNYQYNQDIGFFGDLGKTSVGSNSENSMGIGVFYNLGKIVSFSDNVALKGSVHTIKMQSLGTSGYVDSNLTCTNGGVDIDPFTLEPVIYAGSCLAAPYYQSGTSGSSSKLTAYSVELLMAGKPIEQLSLADGKVPSWYANAGVHSFSGSDTDSEFSIGGGLVLPVSFGEAYVAVDYISDLVLGFGIRYNFE